MRILRAAAALSSAVALTLSGCGTPPDAGSVEISWFQEQGDPVGEGVLPHGATLLPDQDSWTEWVADLPADMREAKAAELDSFSLEDSVAVVTVWGRCTETSHLYEDGNGALVFEVIDDEPNTNCVWSPRRVEVWDVPLDTLGVARDEVTLAG